MRGKLGLVSRQQPLPLQVPGLTGWWDASDSATLFDAETGGSLVAADGEVGRLQDKSGFARHWKQSTSASRPLRKTSVRNSLDVLRFDGTDDFLLSDFLYDQILSSTSYTVIAAAKCAAASLDEADPIFNEFLMIDENFGAYGVFYFTSAGAVGAMGVDVNVSPVQSDFATTPYTIGNWGVFSQRYDGTNLSIRLDGGAASSTTSPPYSEINSPARLGSNFPGGAWFDGDLGELVVFNVALSDSDREKVESYLADKWNP
jgi:hypothetical protein